MPPSPGNARALAMAARSSTCPAMIAPLCAPFSRRMRVRRRVSMSAMATMPWCFRYSGSACFGAPAGHARRQIPDHQPRRVYLRGLLVLTVHAGVADMRIGKGNDLAAVGRIGQDFLVPGDRGVEHHLPRGHAVGADRSPPENRSVGERKHGGRQQGQNGLRDTDTKTGRAPRPSRCPVGYGSKLYRRIAVALKSGQRFRFRNGGRRAALNNHRAGRRKAGVPRANRRRTTTAYYRNILILPY